MTKTGKIIHQRENYCQHSSLTSLDKKIVKSIVDLLKGHFELNKQVKTMCLTEDAVCRFCQAEEESSEHVPCKCNSLANTVSRKFTGRKLQARTFTRIHYYHQKDKAKGSPLTLKREPQQISNRVCSYIIFLSSILV